MSKIITDKKKIDELLTRGVAEVIERDHLQGRLQNGEKLRVKFGIDPTGPILHLGHSVALRVLRRFQELGHTVIFLVGDFTARIGDPTGRIESRPRLNDQEIRKNMKTYAAQAGKILDMSRVEVRYNNEWFGKMHAMEMFTLFGRVTYGQVIARRDFKKRLAEDEDFTFSEFMYPVYQGYDSVALNADVEVGGTDQKFNMLMGRRIQKRYGQTPQDVVTVSLLEGLDGVKKMSKSEDNYIGLAETPESTYGKIMTIPDALILRYFELCSTVALSEIEKMRTAIQQGANPRDAKMRLAREIVALLHGPDKAQQAEENFVKLFQRREKPEIVKEVKIRSDRSQMKRLNICDALVFVTLASSKSEARRLVEQKGVKVDGKIVDDPGAMISIIKSGVLIQKGKRHFVRVRT